jgi:hypothetical protein
MCKRNSIFYQRNIKLMFAHVNNMCKRTNIFYERNIRLVFAHVNSMCKSSNIFYMNETSNLCSRTWTTCASVAAYFYGSMPQDIIIPTPPHPISNVASCRCASAKERYYPQPTPPYHDRIITTLLGRRVSR